MHVPPDDVLRYAVLLGALFVVLGALVGWAFAVVGVRRARLVAEELVLLRLGNAKLSRLIRRVEMNAAAYAPDRAGEQHDNCADEDGRNPESSV